MKKVYISAGFLSVIVVIAAIIIISSNSKTTNKSNSNDTAQVLGTTTSIVSNDSYKDGTFTASGNYISPDGPQSIGVTITVSGNNITDVKIDNQAFGESAMYINRFSSGVKNIVIGKSLGTSFNVQRVNGSSLTGEGFQQALNQIKSQAKI